MRDGDTGAVSTEAILPAAVPLVAKADADAYRHLPIFDGVDAELCGKLISGCTVRQ